MIVDKFRQSVLEVDSRRRISLGALAEHDRYLVEVEEDGTIADACRGHVGGAGAVACGDGDVEGDR